MKLFLAFCSVVFLFIVSCTPSHSAQKFENQPLLSNDTLRITNKAIDYEVLIIDGGFTSWFNSNAKPRNYYSQSFLEARNRFWVLEWNRRALLPNQYNLELYEMQINYETAIDYGYEVNYMIYNYLVYFQLTHKQQLGGFIPRI